MIHCGDARTVLQTLPDASVQCVVTSPPYWGLRDYGTARWDGGDPGCSHIGSESRTNAAGTAKQASNKGSVSVHAGHCRCGAQRIDAQLGLEPTPEAYVANLVAVFAEVWRVLRDDGTVWLNLGDSYQCAKGQAHGVDPKQPARRHGLRPNDRSIVGLKPKDLVGIPWRVAFALQAAGWYLRSDIIWAKPNPMPESVTDRPTKAHEYLFLLTKSPRYYYDAAAIREPYVRIWDETSGGSWAHTENQPKGTKAGEHSGAYPLPKYRGQATKDYEAVGAQNPSDVKRRILEAQSRPEYAGANKRSVWSIATSPYPEAHFATFPEALVEPCILAGSIAGDSVLDPFAGAGTVGVVCAKAQRQFLGIELNPEYVALAERRIAAVAPLFLPIAGPDEPDR